jgi:hypothetical protein
MLLLDRPAVAFRALRVASAMLSLIGFAALGGIVGQGMHAPLRPVRLDAILVVALVVLLLIAPLSWFAINAIRPLLLLPIAGLALWPVVAYFEYLQRAGGSIGLDLLYGTVVPNIPIVFVLWAGLTGLRLTQAERAVTRTLEPGIGHVSVYVGVLRSLFGVWPGLRRSLGQAAVSGVFIYLGQVIQGLALVLVGAVLLLAPGEIARFSDAGADALLILFLTPVLIVLLMLVSAGLRNLGRLVSRQSLEKQVGRDDRPPILFLRGFKDDQATLPRGGILHRFLRVEFGRRRLDHVLVEEFSRFGPVVALGRPGQRSLPFGAARIYVQHDDWQAKVLELAERSAHIVLVADDGAGVAWEIEIMLSGSLRAKTIFLATERLGDLRASAQLRSVVEVVEGETIARSSRLIGAFESGGRLVAMSASRPSPEAYIVALQAFFRRDRIGLG